MIQTTERLFVSPDCALTFLDPSKVRHSYWNRVIECGPHQPEFERLKSAIELVGGNVQPIKVRPNIGTFIGASADDAQEDDGFEIVFGHSRLRACFELGLPVFAMVERVSDWEAIQQFAAEFRSYPAWRPWRLGSFLDRVISTGLLKSIRKAGEILAMDLTEIKLLIDLVSLPASIQGKYNGVILQPAQARKLLKAFQDDPKTMRRNAIEKDFSMCRTAQAVMSVLTEQRS